MRTTFNLNIYCRQSKAAKNGYAPLELSIIINGKRCFINLPYKAIPSEVNRKRKPKELQEYINVTMANITKLLTDMAKNDIPLTTNNLRNVIQTGGVQSYTVERLFKDYLALLKKRVGIDLTSGAYRKYELVMELFFNHMDKNKEVTEITPSVIQSFYISLQSQYNNTTSASYIAKTKTFIQYGLDNDKIKINPFQSLKVKREKKKIDYLSEQELSLLSTTHIENDCLNAVRNAFLLQCYSGLSYIDLEHLTENDIQITENGTHYIHKQRVKTGVDYTAVILQQGIQILKNNNYKLKIISNQKMNLYLKQVMVLCNINHNLTTHLGRKTYGHILLNSGVRMETVAKALGHSNSKTTAKYYAEVESNTVIQEIVQSL